MKTNIKNRIRNNRRAFTLMEVLLVLGILGVIMAMVVPKVLGRQKYASIDATKVSMGGLTQAIRMYSMDHNGDLPGMNDGLSVLMKQPSRPDPNWRGPYIEQDPKDAWGQAFKYVRPGKNGDQSFDIVSAGPDRVFGTPDDILSTL